MFRKLHCRTAVVAATGAMLLAGCAETPQDLRGGDESVRIGAVLDITGVGASLGVPERMTLEMLTADVNAAGGIAGRKLELIIEDNQSKEDTAAKVASKLVNEDQVDVLLGTSRTGTSLAMRSIAEASRTPMISLAASFRIIDGSQWVFKTAQNDRVVLEKIIDHAVDAGWRSLGLIRDGSAYGEGVGETLSELGAQRDVRVVSTEKFDPEGTEFTAQMLNTRSASADANVIWGIPPAAALALNAYRLAGIEAPIVLGHGVANEQFLATAGAAAEGVLVPQGPLLVVDELPDGHRQREVIKTFVDDYKSAHGGQVPSPFASYAADAFRLAVTALERAGTTTTDRSSIRDHLEGVRDYVGVTGVYDMSTQDHSGLDKSDLVMVTVRDGAWRLLESAGGSR